MGLGSSGGGTALGDTISFAGPGQPNHPDFDPVSIYQKLFPFANLAPNAPPAAPDPELARRQLLLDAVNADAEQEEVEELDRGSVGLGRDGVIVGTNIQGRALDDPVFEPLWGRADGRRLPVLLNPMSTMAGTRHMAGHALVPMVGFPFDTTLAVVRLMWTGFMDRHPHLRLIALHAGGALPFLAGRLEIGADAYAENRQVAHRPSEYLRRIFYDTVSYHPPALRLVAETAGASQLVFGTAYPHVIGDPRRVLESLSAAGFEPEEMEAIAWRNARDGLGLDLP